jgi:RHS repeat-associated protein
MAHGPNRRELTRQIFHVLLTLLMLVSLWAVAHADQPSSSTQGGRPAGSYDLSDFDNVNLFNGNLNFRLPLLSVGGRGEASFTIPYVIENRWTTSVGYEGQCPVYTYSSLGLGWVKAGFADLVDASSTYDFVDAGEFSYCNNSYYQPTKGLFALALVTADGTTYTFRSVANSGPVSIVPGCSWPVGTNLGTQFITWDGSGMKLVADYDVYYNGHTYTMRTSSNGAVMPSGWTVLFPNGSRFRIQPSTAQYHPYDTWLEDRNGNRLNFIYGLHGQSQSYYGVKQIIDSNGRTVNIDYLQDEAPYGLHTKITYKGFNGSTRVIRVGMNDLKVWLPDGRTYAFTYNSNSELTRVDLPTGGAYEYEWGGNIPVPTEPCQAPNDVAFRYVTERRVKADGVNLSSKMTFSAPNGTTQVDTYDAASNLVARSKHYFHGSPAPQLPPDNPHWTYASDQENLTATKGKEYRTEAYASNGTLLRVIESTWVTPRQVTWSTYGEPSQTININARVELNQSTLTDISPNLVAKTEYLYNQGQWASTFFNVLTDTFQYDYGQGVPGAFLSRSHSEYLSYDTGSYQNQPYIPLLPSETWVSSDAGGSNKASLVRYEYDNYTSDTNHAPLVDRQSVIGHNSNLGTGYTSRGNVTKVTSYANAQNQTGEVSVYSQYDIAGNVVKAIDGRGYATTFDFSDRFGTPDGEARSNSGANELAGQYSYAFPTLITNAPGHTAYIQFDYYLGQPVDSEDVNGVVSSASFNDTLDRPTQMIRAANQSTVKSQTTFSYDDVNRIITMTSDQASYNDNALVGKTLYDGLGRTIETRQYEGGANYIAVQQQYDVLGHALKTSNPFRPWSSETAVWTTTAFDALGRIVSVTAPDNAVVTNSYSGNQVTATDQTGKQRKSVTDAFGRLTQSYEDPAGLNYLTSYSYDVLGNLTTVSQGSQTRTFVYDSLKRLTSATNPESGTINYQYDANGNLTSKTDARSITVTYTYDALSRALTRSYSDGTPSVTFSYDSTTITNGKGRPASVSSSVSSYSYSGYDALGRALGGTQTIGSQNYSVGYSYNLAGRLLTETYPSGRTVTNAYDSAGRTTSVAGNLGDSTTRTYATGINYSSFGGITREQYGTTPTPLYHKTFYNIRGQMFDTRLSSVNDTWDWNRGRLILYYSSNHAWGGSGTDNNGNLIYAENWVPPPNATPDQAQTLTQDSYTYDALNRLSAVNESTLDIAGGGSWISQFAQVYSYDRYGNRTINQASTWGTNIPKPNFGVDSATNRLSPPAGYSMTYDQVGNLTNDTYSGEGTRTYDAESRMKQAWANNQWQTYTYDGNGQRVKRNVNGTETWQVYGLGGELLAEYAANGSPSSPQKEYAYRNGQLLVTAEPSANIHWLVTDQLDTPRMIFDQSGSLSGVSRHDYLPFGEELYAGVGLRGAQQGYVGDSARQKFTSYERDSETALDFAQARYYRTAQGRFTRPDPWMASADEFEPQSWNRYSYVGNNPLAFTDPLGMFQTQAEDLLKLKVQQNPQKKPGYPEEPPPPMVLKLDVVKISIVADKNTGRNLTAAEISMAGIRVDGFDDWNSGGGVNATQISQSPVAGGLNPLYHWNPSRPPSVYRPPSVPTLRPTEPPPELPGFPRNWHIENGRVKFGPNYNPDQTAYPSSKFNRVGVGIMRLLGSTIQAVTPATRFIDVMPIVVCGPCMQHATQGPQKFPEYYQ